MAKLNRTGRIAVVTVIAALSLAIGVPLGLGLGSTTSGDGDRPKTVRQVCEEAWEANAHRFAASDEAAYIDACIDSSDNVDALRGR